MNKQLKRFLCFFLCFCLCFAWFGEPLEAKAAGELLLIGILLSYMIGVGLGFAVNGTADSLIRGIEELVNEYQATHDDVELNFWDVIFGGSAIGLAGELLLSKEAVDAMNGFISWLQESQGWTAGSSIDYIENTLLFYDDLVQIDINGVVSSLGVMSNTSGSYLYCTDLYSLYSFGSVGTMLYPGDCFTMVFNDSSAFSYISTSVLTVSDNWDIYASGLSTPWYVASELVERVSKSVDDIVGLSFVFDINSSLRRMYLCFVYSDGTCQSLAGSYEPLRSSKTSLPTQLYSLASSSTIVIPTGGISSFDTVDWDELYRLGLFGGSAAGSIPNSVEDYNQNVIDQLNDGVIPDISTDVIVQEAPPITSDGTLEGDVSAIFQSIAALPQTLANLVLDGIKNIFVPDPDDMNSQFMALLDEVNEKYSFGFDLNSLFSGEKEPDDITAQYTVGPLSWDLTFVSWHYLKKGVEFFRPFIRGFIVLMLIFYNLRQFMAIFGLGGVMNGDSADRRVADLAV